MRILLAIIAIYYTYHFLWFLIGLGIHVNKKRNFEEKCKSRFAIVIPAHNEENVIKQTIKSLKNLQYDKDKFDIFVIADNCTDRTAEISRKLGVIVMDRHLKIRGKQYAIGWFINSVCLDKYDALVILDADNTADPYFLKALDAELSKGHKVIQGYVATQNPNDTWITANYAYIFWYLCRINLAKSVLGLSCWLAGTGFCISTEVIKKYGWNLNTVTDDVEYTCQLILAGERIYFAPLAVVYDQKPQKLQLSLKQRLRWIRGQTQVTVKYIPKLFYQAFKSVLRGNLKTLLQAIDAILWIPMHFVTFTSVLISFKLSGWEYIFNALISIPVFFMLPMIAEGVRGIKAWKYIFTSGLFYFTWLPITVYGVVTCGKKNWWRTPHHNMHYHSNDNVF